MTLTGIDERHFGRGVAQLTGATVIAERMRKAQERAAAARRRAEAQTDPRLAEKFRREALLHEHAVDLHSMALDQMGASPSWNGASAVDEQSPNGDAPE